MSLITLERLRELNKHKQEAVDWVGCVAAGLIWIAIVLSAPHLRAWASWFW